MRCGDRLTRRFRRVPALLCLVATLVMVSPYQGKVNGILTLAGQQTKKPEYDKEKTQLAPPRGHTCVEGQVVIRFWGYSVVL